MLVYRVAHASVVNRETGFPAGPYRSDPFHESDHKQKDEILALIDSMGWAHDDDDHRSPMRDPELEHKIYSSEICGMDSKKSLVQWFEGYLERLFEFGFKVWTYDVPDEDTRTGMNGQVLFRHKSASEVPA